MSSLNYVGNPPAPAGVVLVGDTNPIGSINWFHRPPDASWLPLDGRTVSKATYADLWAYASGFTTSDQAANPGLYRDIDAGSFALPNLSGLFVRGVGQVDASHVAGNLGAKQAFDTGRPLVAPATMPGIMLTTANGAPGGTGNIQVNWGANNSQQFTTWTGETRPVNVALVPCVKALKTLLIPANSYPLPATLGTLLQRVAHNRSDWQQVTAAIPLDDTIPQITEGTEIFSVTLTPNKVGNLIQVRGIVHLSPSAADWPVCALFLNGAANAVNVQFSTAQAGWIVAIPVAYDVSAPSLSPMVFALRTGSNGSAVRLNGTSARFYGGVVRSYLQAEEYSQ
jgi:hypothetical protein